MPINFKNKINEDDFEIVNKHKNPPEYAEGFAPTDDDYTDFSSFSDDFSSPSSSNDFGATDFGSGTDDFAGGGLPNWMNSGPSMYTGGFDQGMNNTPETKKDAYDVLLEKAGVAGTSFWSIFKTTITSFKQRSGDDFGAYGKNLMQISMGLVGVSVLFFFIGIFSGAATFQFAALPLTLLTTSLISFSIGLISLVVPAYLISTGKLSATPRAAINNFADDNMDFMSDFSAEDDLGVDESEFNFDTEDFSADMETESEPEDTSFTLDQFFDATEIPTEVDYEKEVDKIHPNQPIINRAFLFNTFKQFFPGNIKKFSEVKEIQEGTNEYRDIETLTYKAMAAAMKVDFDSFPFDKTGIASITETLFTYEIQVKRLKGLKNLDDLAKEVVAYCRSNSNDYSVSAQVELEGDYYHILILKGAQHLVTLGDILNTPEAEEFFCSEKNKLPFVVGLKSNGKPCFADAKILDSMLIAGRPRSGKSWFIYNVLMNLFAFNTPEDVQCVIVDPKNSALMYALSLLPHVCGFHTHDRILDILKDIIENEGKRREKLLFDHKVDDIWDLREKTGIKLPVLYLFIDEYMTVQESLDKDGQKELTSQLRVLISQLPSKGIRLIFIPHRAQGVVDKTLRSMIGFSAAIKATPNVVTETLDISKFDISLVNPGDMAIMMVGENRASYIKGNAVTLSDEENKELAKHVARAFYKMGVDIPDMSSLRLACNRDEAKVKEALYPQNVNFSDKLKK